MTKKRNIGQELLEGVRAIKRGKGKRVRVNLPKDVRAIREKVGLSQSAFAALLGMSARTLQEWEQGRRTPTGPAYALLRVAERHPKALLL
jgi:putative transcriptional regulator